MIGSASNINHYLNLFGVQKGLSPEKPASAASGQSSGAADVLTLSPTADMLRQFLGMDLQGTDAQPGESDLTGLAQLKQHGDMLSNMLQLKLRNFESHLVSSMKSAGLDPSRSMEIKDDAEGLSLLGDRPDQAPLQKLLGENALLQGQFREIGHLAGVLEALQQVGASSGVSTNPLAGIGSAARYAQQSTQARGAEPRPEAEFVLRVMEGRASYTFE